MSESERVEGMLYIVDLSVFDSITKETIKYKILTVGNKIEDIERRLKFVLLGESNSKLLRIKHVSKVRDKVHLLSTTITNNDDVPNINIIRGESSAPIFNNFNAGSGKLYAVGIVTSVFAVDPEHALRKVCNAVLNRKAGKDLVLEGAHATLTVEEIPSSSGYASARDVSDQINSARFVRG